MRTIQNQTFDEERALYGNSDILVKDCSFDGPADGESAFKECKDVQVAHSFFNLRVLFICSSSSWAFSRSNWACVWS